MRKFKRCKRCIRVALEERDVRRFVQVVQRGKNTHGDLTESQRGELQRLQAIVKMTRSNPCTCEECS